MRRKERLNLATFTGAHVSVADLADWLEVERRTVIKMIEVGALHGFKVGRQWRVPTAAARTAFPSQQHQA